MADRPIAQVEIVPPNTVIPLRNRDETFNLVELLPQLMAVYSGQRHEA